MPGVNEQILLGPVLRDVSRTFYWTLRVLPGPMRIPVGLAYLLARTADTIADTEVLSAAERLERLLAFRNLLVAPGGEAVESFQHSLAASAATSDAPELRAERSLLDLLPESFSLFRSLETEDRRRVAGVVTELTTGMELDLRRFPREGGLNSLRTLEELEDYTYRVAGCVGPFWTRMCIAHLPEFAGWPAERMCELGIRFGKALQWTNVLRDLPRDLRNNRCYLPTDGLERNGVKPVELLEPANYGKVRSIYQEYLDHTLDYYRSAWEYTTAIPRSCHRVRLACIWPQWIGLETIALLRRAENPLDGGERIRIGRGRVYTIIGFSSALAPFPAALEQYATRLLRLAQSSHAPVRSNET